MASFDNSLTPVSGRPGGPLLLAARRHRIKLGEEFPHFPSGYLLAVLVAAMQRQQSITFAAVNVGF